LAADDLVRWRLAVPRLLPEGAVLTKVSVDPKDATRQWLDLDDPRQVERLSTSPIADDIVADGLDFNAYNIPWVVGAKKGLPNFQEGFWQSRLQTTRRLRISKRRG
jgi:hypothetical protein